MRMVDNAIRNDLLQFGVVLDLPRAAGIRRSRARSGAPARGLWRSARATRRPERWWNEAHRGRPPPVRRLRRGPTARVAATLFGTGRILSPAMPELPEVEALCRSFDARLRGRVIEKVNVRSVAVLKNVRPTGYRTRGPGVRRLRAPGQVHRPRGAAAAPRRPSRPRRVDPAARYAHECATVASRAARDDRDARGWRQPRVTEHGTDKRLAVSVVRVPADVPGLGRLGIDALDPELTAARLGTLFEEQRGTLKSVLADQSVIAGIGNAYSDEILHAAQLSPFRHADALSSDELERLATATRDVLTAAVTLAVRVGSVGAQGWKAGVDAGPRSHRAPLSRLRGHRSRGVARRDVNTALGARPVAGCSRTGDLAACADDRARRAGRRRCARASALGASRLRHHGPRHHERRRAARGRCVLRTGAHGARDPAGHGHQRRIAAAPRTGGRPESGVHVLARQRVSMDPGRWHRVGRRRSWPADGPGSTPHGACRRRRGLLTWTGRTCSRSPSPSAG